MGKRAFIPAWDGKEHVEGLTRIAEPPPKAAAPAAEAIPAAILEAAAEATPEATAPATEAPAVAGPVAAESNPFASVDPNLMAFAAVLLVKRLRELREEEKKQ